MTFDIDDRQIIKAMVDALFRLDRGSSPFNDAANCVIAANRKLLERVIAEALGAILADEQFKVDLDIALRESLKAGLKAKVQTAVSALPRPEVKKLAIQMGLLETRDEG